MNNNIGFFSLESINFIVHYCYILFSFYACICSAAVSQLTWANDTLYPIAFWDAVAFTGQDNFIYVFGGYNGSNNYDFAVSNAYKFNSSSWPLREWIAISSMPFGVTAATGCVSNDGGFFIFGGLEPYGTSPSDIQIYSPIDNEWDIVTPELPSGAFINDSYMSCAIDSSSGIMYLTGGEVFGSRFYSYNISSNSIMDHSTSLSNLYNLNGQGSFVSNSGKLYVFGGLDSLTGYFSAFTYIYDIAKDSWSTGVNMSQGAAGFGYVTDGNRFYVIGGNGNSGFLQNTQVYDISTNVWSLDNGIVFPGGISDNSAVLSDGNLHSLGGYSNYKNLSIHRIASLCGVYAFSGPCNDEYQCIINGICKSNGQCIGTCISGCNCSQSITSSTIASTFPISIKILSSVVFGTLLFGQVLSKTSFN